MIVIRHETARFDNDSHKLLYQHKVSVYRPNDDRFDKQEDGNSYMNKDHSVYNIGLCHLGSYCILTYALKTESFHEDKHWNRWIFLVPSLSLWQHPVPSVSTPLASWQLLALRAVYPKKYAHCSRVVLLCYGFALVDFNRPKESHNKAKQNSHEDFLWIVRVIQYDVMDSQKAIKLYI